MDFKKIHLRMDYRRNIKWYKLRFMHHYYHKQHKEFYIKKCMMQRIYSHLILRLYWQFKDLGTISKRKSTRISNILIERVEADRQNFAANCMKLYYALVPFYTKVISGMNKQYKSYYLNRKSKLKVILKFLTEELQNSLTSPRT